MKRFVLTLGANQDLDEIDEYLAREFGNVVAEHRSEKLFQAFELIASQPNMGSSRTAWTDDRGVVLARCRYAKPHYLPRGRSCRDLANMEQ